MSDDQSITLETTVKHIDGVFWQDVVEDVVMLDVEKGQYFGAENTGAHIWRLFEQPVTVAVACDQMMDDYDVDRETCEAEVLSFVTQLHEAGLVEVA